MTPRGEVVRYSKTYTLKQGCFVWRDLFGKLYTGYPIYSGIILHWKRNNKKEVKK